MQSPGQLAEHLRVGMASGGQAHTCPAQPSRPFKTALAAGAQDQRLRGGHHPLCCLLHCPCLIAFSVPSCQTEHWAIPERETSIPCPTRLLLVRLATLHARASLVSLEKDVSPTASPEQGAH